MTRVFDCLPSRYDGLSIEGREQERRLSSPLYVPFPVFQTLLEPPNVAVSTYHSASDTDLDPDVSRTYVTFGFRSRDSVEGL